MHTRKRICGILFVLVLALSAMAGCGSPISETAQDPGNDPPAGDAADSPAADADPGGPITDLDMGNPMTLTLGHPYSTQDYRSTSMDFFADRVKELSGGNITVNTFPSGTFTTSQDALKSVATGSADMAAGALSFNVSEVPDLAPLDIQGIYDPAYFWETYELVRPVLDRILEGQNQMTLIMFDETDSVFYLNKSNRRDVHTPADIAGLRLRDHGTWIGKSISAWGASPMTVVPADVTVALERGTVDGGFTGLGAVLTWRAMESAPHITVTNIAKSCWAPLTINLDLWNSMTDGQRQVIAEAAQQAEDLARELVEEDNARFFAEIENIGGTVYEMTREETQAFVDATQPLIDEARELCGDLGGELIDALLSAPSNYR